MDPRPNEHGEARGAKVADAALARAVAAVPPCGKTALVIGVTGENGWFAMQGRARRSRAWTMRAAGPGVPPTVGRVRARGPAPSALPTARLAA